MRCISPLSFFEVAKCLTEVSTPLYLQAAYFSCLEGPGRVYIAPIEFSHGFPKANGVTNVLFPPWHRSAAVLQGLAMRHTALGGSIEAGLESSSCRWKLATW